MQQLLHIIACDDLHVQYQIQMSNFERETPWICGGKWGKQDSVENQNTIFQLTQLSSVSYGLYNAMLQTTVE